MAGHRPRFVPPDLRSRGKAAGFQSHTDLIRRDQSVWHSKTGLSSWPGASVCASWHRAAGHGRADAERTRDDSPDLLSEKRWRGRCATGGDLATSRPGVGRTVRRLTTETKQAFKTTEFWAMVGLVVAILISAALIKGGDNGTDEFIARQAWLYVSILGAGYFISRGLAKSGSREPYTDGPNDRGDDGSAGDRNGRR
jgi:hypothetical protein